MTKTPLGGQGSGLRMASGRYSFIDIAVLEKVRTRFAAGDALALLSVDLDEIVWANGAGAALFGHADVEAAMGAPSGLGFVPRRQIAAAPGFPAIEGDRTVMARLGRGVAGAAIPFTVAAVTLPDGMPAVLLAASSGAGEGERQAAIVAGFEEAGYFAALLDAEAKVLAASGRFYALGIAQATLSALAAEAAREADRLVKRMIPAGEAVVPAGIARLTDAPEIFLLIGIADAQDAEESPPDTAGNDVAENDVADLAAPSDADLPERIGEADDAPAVSVAAGDSDDWYFDGDNEEAQLAPAPIPAAPLVKPDLAAGPVRFVWRTDAKGAFSAVSPEFAAAIGSQAAEIIGRSFRDVADSFGLDPDGEIASLLERRDTWSGRTVAWPVSGTDLVAPVDLAALPVYNRDRVFEGFRGFGVARMDDARPDPHARGLRLGDEPSPPEPISGRDDAEPDAADSEPAPFGAAVPVISITERLNRRVSDKIIRLAEHRPSQPEPEPAARQLSPGERSAFEEIRDRLRRETGAQAQAARTEDARTEDAKPDEGRAETRDQPAEEGAAPELASSAGIEAWDEPDEDTAFEPTVEENDAPAPEAATEGDEDDADLPIVADDADEAVAFDPIYAGEAEDGENPQPVAPLLSSEGESRPGVDPELIAGLPLPLLVHAGDALYFANREFLELTGYASLDDIRAAGGLDRLFVDDEGVEARPAERKLHVRRLDGETFPVDAHLQSIGWREGTALLLSLRRAGPETAGAAQGEAVASVPAAPDSDMAAETEELARHLAELRTIIDTATDGVVLIAPDGTIRNISRPAEALFGLDSAAVEGRPFASLFAIESQKSARDYLAGLADNGVASVLNDGREVIGREAEGRFIPLFMTIGRLPEESGYCAVLRDITQFKRAEEELTQARAQAERASSQKTEFLARISHEIRTPLNAIIGFSELMMDEKFGPIGSDRYRDYLRDINRSGNHVLDLVNDLLDISKIEAGEQEMNYEAVSLNEALSEAIAMMQPQANRERVIIRSSLASRLPDVVADLRSVRQIALNLLSNAIRYTQAGGQVIVSTAYELSGDVAMRVRDTGIGMTLAEIDQALKPFKRINALKRGRHDGTGLGLPLTKAMVEANRARFAISSTPGEGTLVEIVFPSTRVLAE